MTVLAAQFWPTNADMIVDVVALGYIKPTDSVVDLTFGRGTWWKKYNHPCGDFIGCVQTDSQHDRLAKHWQDRVMVLPDFHDLSTVPGSYAKHDVVAFDPPYVCASLDTEILTQRGWLTWAEVRVGDMAYSIDPASGLGCWAKIEGTVVLPNISRRMVEMEGNSHSSLTTAGHRWFVTVNKGQAAWRTSSTFGSSDTVPCRALSADQTHQPTLADGLVEILAWWWAEGHVEGSRAGSNGAGGYGQISQSHVVNPANCQRIESALEATFGPRVAKFPRTGRTTDGRPRWRRATDGNVYRYFLSADAARHLNAYMPNMVPTWHSFFQLLTHEQLALWIHTATKAEGNDRGLAQRSVAMAESFALACTLAGHRISIRRKLDGMTKVEMMTSRGFRPHRQPLYKVSEQTCAVWCVTTTTGTWMARRNGTVYFTGNCVGGRATTTIPDFYDRYGLVHAARTPELLCESNNLAMEQAMAILKPGGHLLVKCQDYVSSGKLFLGTHWTLTAALGMGLECCERFEHVGHARAQPPGRRQVHARRNLSTLFIFRKPRKDRRGSTPTFA